MGIGLGHKYLYQDLSATEHSVTYVTYSACTACLPTNQWYSNPNHISWWLLSPEMFPLIILLLLASELQQSLQKVWDPMSIMDRFGTMIANPTDNPQSLSTRIAGSTGWWIKTLFPTISLSHAEAFQHPFLLSLVRPLCLCYKGCWTGYRMRPQGQILSLAGRCDAGM